MGKEPRGAPPVCTSHSSPAGRRCRQIRIGVELLRTQCSNSDPVHLCAPSWVDLDGLTSLFKLCSCKRGDLKAAATFVEGLLSRAAAALHY